MASKPTRKEMADLEKGQIIAFDKVGKRISEIARQIDRPRSTVASFLSKYHARGTHENAHRSGRPQLLDERSKRRLVRATKKNRRMPLGELQLNTHTMVSRSTIKRALLEQNIQKWVAAQRPLLTEKHAWCRLEWALMYEDWTEDDWESACWSDECSVERSSDPSTIWVFRTPEEKWEKDCIFAKSKGKGISVMVWGAFHGKTLGPLIPFVVTSIDSKVYLSLLQSYLPELLEHIQEINNRPGIFMQDNAPVHKAQIVTTWLEREGYTLMKWPPYSPDLNPIEHVWKRLKEKLQQQHPYIATMKGGKEAVKAKLREVLPQVWETIEPDYLNNLSRSMCTRVNAVITAKGWYTKY